jgi:fimbrial chaperone protein
MNLNRFTKTLLPAFLLFFIGSNLDARVQVYPLRVFLDQRKPGQEITVRNLSSQAGSYRISTVLFLQKEDGSMMLSEGDELYERNLSDNIRFSPRVVQLGPGESQTVRIFARNVAAFSEGDYRTHLRFEQTLESFQENLNDKQEAAPGQIKTGLEARVAISIPVFYRRGNPSYNLSLEDLKVNIDRENLANSSFSITMNNSGNAIPYGSFHLFMIGANGDKTQIGTVHGAQSFLPVRKFSYPISDILEHQSKVLAPEVKSYLVEFHSTRENEESIIIAANAQL